MTPDYIKLLIESKIPTFVIEHDKGKIVSSVMNIINQALADKQEACAKLCDRIASQHKAGELMSTAESVWGERAARECAKAIREKK